MQSLSILSNKLVKVLENVEEEFIHKVGRKPGILANLDYRKVFSVENALSDWATKGNAGGPSVSSSNKENSGKALDVKSRLRNLNKSMDSTSVGASNERLRRLNGGFRLSLLSCKRRQFFKK